MLTSQRNEARAVKKILSVTKILILFLLAAVIVRAYTDREADTAALKKMTLFLSVSLIVLSGLYFVLSRTIKAKPAAVILSSLEYIMLFAAVSITSFISGEIKFVLLLFVFAAGIEYETAGGMAAAALSSVFLFIQMYLPVTRENILMSSELFLAAALFTAAYISGKYSAVKNAQLRMLAEKSYTDPLTGLLSHRGFFDKFREIMDESTLTSTPVSLILIDIDDFRIYNELNGFESGDAALRDISVMLGRITGGSSVISRYGGEEFALILNGTDSEKAYEIADSIRLEISAADYAGQEKMPFQNLTASVGLATYPDHGLTCRELVSSAEDAVLKAKFLQKDNVAMYSDVFKILTKEFESDNETDMLASVKALIAVINSRDSYTYKHTERVVNYCLEFAKFISMSRADTKMLLTAAYLHDIGKINIPRSTLLKTGSLTEEEWTQLKSHSQKGAEMVKEIPNFENLAEIIYQHHERYDGSGYPLGIKGEEIHYLARILAVADAFDAMTSPRPYQRKVSYKDSCEELLKCRGTHFDPKIAEEFVRMIDRSYQQDAG